jgi:hypothetical protein
MSFISLKELKKLANAVLDAKHFHDENAAMHTLKRASGRTVRCALTAAALTALAS